MKDLGKSSESELESESEAHAAQVAATFNLSLGSSGSLFATSSSSSTATTTTTEPDLTATLTTTSTTTLTQSHSQTMRHLSPRQSPRQSPKQDIEVIEIFESEAERLAASQQVAVVHQHPAGGKRRERDGETDATARYMDKHLSELEQEDLVAGTCDIVAYMASLREKAFEPGDGAEEAADQQQNDSSLSPEPQTIVENTQQTITVDIESPSSRPATESDSTGTTTGPSERSGDETEDEPTSSIASHIVVIDKKVDKVFKAKSPERATAAAGGGGGAKPKSGSRKSIYISPDRCKSQGSSPVRIIKIKSPRSSVSEQGKRLSICSSRDNSQDRLSGGRRTPSPRRSSEGGGGILKHTTTPGAGILKPPASPAKSKSPDRSCLKKGGPSHVCAVETVTASTLSPRISPRSSVDHLSPDRASICQRHSPRSSFDSHGGSDHNLDVPYGGGSRKRSMSAHGSFETGHKAHAQETYQYYPVYDNQTCSDHYVAAAPTSSRYSRLSKSLERSTSRDSTTTASSSYRGYGVSPERSYVVYSSGPLRSQSAENTFSQPIYDALPHRQAPQQYMPMVSYLQELQDMSYGQPPPQSQLPPMPSLPMHSCGHEPTQSSYQLSSSAPEYTTCIDCLYQKRPS